MSATPRIRRFAAVTAFVAVAALVAPAVTQPATALPRSRRLQAESMAGGVRDVRVGSAAGGRVTLVTASQPVSASAGVGAGTYLVRAKVRGRAARAGLTVAGKRVGERATGSTWRYVEAVARIDGPTQKVGVRAVPRGDWEAAKTVQVDELTISRVRAGLTTRGNRILDAGGRAVIPRGVNRGGLQLTSTGFAMSDADFGTMQRWGASIVRLKISQHFWLDGMCTFDPAYVGRVDAAVSSITRRGMIALVELGRSTQDQWCGGEGMRPLADQLSLVFWREVATRYKANPLVAFDLFNEPHDVTFREWRNGKTFDTWRGVGMQELYDNVRATGARNLTFVSGTSWGYNLRAVLSMPLDGYGIVYGSHPYCLECGGELRSDMDTAITPVARLYPVVLTEFGWNQKSAAYNANVIAWAEARKIGWAVFAWHEWGPEAYGILQSWETGKPNVAGGPVLVALWKARGWTSYGGL
jgi:hypothetical protein